MIGADKCCGLCLSNFNFKERKESRKCMLILVLVATSCISSFSLLFSDIGFSLVLPFSSIKVHVYISVIISMLTFAFAVKLVRNVHIVHIIPAAPLLLNVSVSLLGFGDIGICLVLPSSSIKVCNSPLSYFYAVS